MDEKMDVSVVRKRKPLSRSISKKGKRQRKAYSRAPTRGLKWSTSVVRIKQTVTGAAINGLVSDNVAQLVGVQDLALYFNLAQCSQAATFGALFDMYRIRKIVIKFLPQCQYVSTPDTLTIPTPSGALITVVDNDDATPLASLGAYMEYDNCQFHQSHEMTPTVRTIYPKIAGSAYRGAFTGYTNLPNSTWIDMGTNDVQYYGLKFRVEPYATSGTKQLWRVFADYYLEFKHVR